MAKLDLLFKLLETSEIARIGSVEHISNFLELRLLKAASKQFEVAIAVVPVLDFVKGTAVLSSGLSVLVGD